MEGASSQPNIDYIVTPGEGNLTFSDLLFTLLDNAEPDDDGEITIRIMVADSVGTTAEAAANELMDRLQALGIEAYPEPQHPGY